MALLDYLTLGGVEIANHVRLSAYMAIGAPAADDDGVHQKADDSVALHGNTADRSKAQRILAAMPFDAPWLRMLQGQLPMGRVRADVFASSVLLVALGKPDRSGAAEQQRSPACSRHGSRYAARLARRAEGAAWPFLSERRQQVVRDMQSTCRLTSARQVALECYPAVAGRARSPLFVASGRRVDQ
ncbi:hypothetical protein [Streptomyces sp. NPDC055109]